MIYRCFSEEECAGLSFAVYDDSGLLYASPFFRRETGKADLFPIAEKGERVTDGFLPGGRRILRQRFRLLGMNCILLTVITPDEESDGQPNAELAAEPVATLFRSLLAHAEKDLAKRRTNMMLPSYRLICNALRDEVSDTLECRFPTENDSTCAEIDTEGLLFAMTLLVCDLCRSNKRKISLSFGANGFGRHSITVEGGVPDRRFILPMIEAIGEASGFSVACEEGRVIFGTVDCHSDIYALRATDFGDLSFLRNFVYLLVGDAATPTD